MTLWKIIRTGVDGSIPIYTTIHSGMRKYSTQASSDISGTRITIVTTDTTTDPPYGINVNPKIGNIRKSATPDLRDSDKLDTSIDGNSTNNLVAPTIFTDVLSNKPSKSSSRGIYDRTGIHLTEDPVNSVTPQFVDLGFYTVEALDKGAGIWTPDTIFGGPTDVSHWSALDDIF